MAEHRYRKGEFIEDRWQVLELLGAGGFGEVYLARNLQWRSLCALKTIRQDYIGDLKSRESFKREALLWLVLGEHEFIVTAQWVAMFSGRLIVEMDYIAPDELGRVSLFDHLRSAAKPLNTDRILKWTIEFCYGMEHACRQGIKCHQDIKPSNILIGENDTLKISDFGLAQGARDAWQHDSCPPLSGSVLGSFSFSIVESAGKRICGTLGYIAPELLRGKEANVQSDIYSFGLVLWQMAAGSCFPPFIVQPLDDIEAITGKLLERQLIGRFPPVAEPLQRMVGRCLAPDPRNRYENFEELRKETEELLFRRTHWVLDPPQESGCTSSYWLRRGSSLNCLGRHEEAITRLSKAIELDSQNVAAWNNKGVVLKELARLEEAFACFCKVLEIDPRLATGWSNKGLILGDLGRFKEALDCFSRCTDLNPLDMRTWNNKGLLLKKIGKPEEALACFSKAFEIDSQSTSILLNMGTNLSSMGRRKDALACYELALEIDPLDQQVLLSKGLTLGELDQLDRASDCFDKILAINPRHTGAWVSKGSVFRALGQPDKAIACYDCALEVDPLHAAAWTEKGRDLRVLSRPEEALSCYTKALEIDPEQEAVWYEKGCIFSWLDKINEAIACYQRTLVIQPKHFGALYQLGLLLCETKQAERGIESFSRALEVNSKRADVLYAKALAQGSLGDLQSAADSFRECIELAKDKPEYSQVVQRAKERLKQLG